MNTSRSPLLNLITMLLREPRWTDEGFVIDEPEIVLGAAPAPELEEVPLPQDARVMGGARFHHGEVEAMMLVTMSDGPADRVADFICTHLAAAGWFVSHDAVEPVTGGPYVEWRQLILLRLDSDYELAFDLWERRDRGVDLRVMMQEPDVDVEKAMVEDQLRRGVLPHLSPPGGAEFRQLEDGLPWDPWQLKAVLVSTESARAVHDEMAQQMRDLGWRPISSRERSRRKESTWDGEALQGTAMIVLLVTQESAGIQTSVDVSFEAVLRDGA